MAETVHGLLEQARDIACEAGRLTLEWFRSANLAVDHKLDGTEVTAADRAGERLIRERISTAFPHDAILGEEEGGRLVPGRRTWVIDPIDGTRGFARGVPLYSTLLALVDDQGPIVGVIDVPALGMTMAAGRGEGCWLGDHRSRVSDHPRLAGALVNTSGFETFHDTGFAALRDGGSMLRTWGDAFGYLMVASGQAEAMVDPVCSTWDLAPMPVIISEAGGRFTDLDGRESFTSGNGLATNGRMHDEMLTLMRRG